MNYKIVVDSSANLKSDYIKSEDIGFEVVPLTIKILDKEYVDNDDINLEEMLAAFHSTKEKATTSCPAPGVFAESFSGAKYVFVITITSQLSGTHNSAVVASKDAKLKEECIHIIDSMSVGPSMHLIVDKLEELINAGKSYEEICKEIDEYRDSLQLLYVLDSFENLVRNGRMSKVTAIIASTLHIKPLCIAENGQIKIYQKIRTYEAAIKRMIMVIKDLKPIESISKVVLTYVNDKQKAEEIKSSITRFYPQIKEIIITKAKGLTGFYALENGILMSF